MASTVKLCHFCRAEIRVPFEAQRRIECPVCGNINAYGGSLLTIHYTGNGPQHDGYQYQHPSLPPPQRPAPPRGPHGGATGHGYYQQPWPPRASDDDYIEHAPPSRQGSFRPAGRTNRNSYQPPSQASPCPMHSPIYYQPQPPYRSSHPTYTNDYYQLAPSPQRSSHPLIKVSSNYRPFYNSYNQQPSQVSLSLPMDNADYYYQNQIIPQASHHPVHDNNYGYNEQEAPTFDDYYPQSSRISPQVSQPQVSNPRVNSNDYYQEQLQTSPPRVHNNNYYYQQPLRTPQPQSISQVSRPQVHSNGSYHRQGSHLESPPQQLYGRKRAVVCGVSYLGQKSSLEASISDARSMKDFLIKNMRFPDTSIFLLTEDEVDPSHIPTRSNMLKALKWLVESCQAGDSLVFYYTGHGSKERDFDGDEIDGFDEVLCPVDYQSAGKITDDEINAIIVRPLPPGAKLHGIIDSCFSGTVLDLPFLSKTDSKGSSRWVDQRIQYAAYKGTSGGIAISISACTDYQKSGDTTAFTGNSTGALTYSFIQALTKQPNITYGNLLNSMRISISKAQERLDQPPQEPQISSSEKFDIHSKPLIM